MNTTTRKNARTTAFPQGVSTFKVEADDYKAEIDAKDFPATGIFRVYRVRGDVTRTEKLKDAIWNLLADHGVDKRKVEISL